MNFFTWHCAWLVQEKLAITDLHFFQIFIDGHYDVYDAGLEFKHLQLELSVNRDATLYDARLYYWEESSEFCLAVIVSRVHRLLQLV